MTVQRTGLVAEIRRASLTAACLALASGYFAASALAQETGNGNAEPTAPQSPPLDASPWGPEPASGPQAPQPAAPAQVPVPRQSPLDELPAWLADIPPPPGAVQTQQQQPPQQRPQTAVAPAAPSWSTAPTPTVRRPWRAPPREWTSPAARRAEGPQGGTSHVGSEILGGIGGLAVATLVGGGALAALMSGCSYDCSGQTLLGGTLAVTSFAFGVPLGVYLAGRGAGGNGTYWSAFGGHLAGALLGGLLLGAAAASESATAIGLGALGFLTLEIGGAVLAYESSTTDVPRLDGLARSRARFTPTLAASQRGATVGLTGAF